MEYDKILPANASHTVRELLRTHPWLFECIREIRTDGGSGERISKEEMLKNHLDDFMWNDNDDGRIIHLFDPKVYTRRTI